MMVLITTRKYNNMVGNCIKINIEVILYMLTKSTYKEYLIKWREV